MKKLVFAVIFGMLAGTVSVQAATPELDALAKETKQLETELNKLNDKLGADKDDLEKISIRLKITKLLSNDVEDIRDKMKTLGKIANIASAVPQIRKPAKLLKDRLDSARKKLKDINNPINKADKKISPVRTAISKSLTTRDQISKNIIKFSNAVNPDFYNEAENIKLSHMQQSCPLNNIPKCETDTEKDASKARMGVRNLANAAAETDEALEDTAKLADDIEDALKPLKSVRDSLDSLTDAMDKLDKSLNKVEKFMKEDIEVSFKYPSPTFDDPGRMKKAEIKIEIGDIIEGPSKIQNMMEKKLGKTLWKAAKAVGVKDIVRDFQEKAEKKANKLMEDLNLDFVPDIKGYDEVKDLAASIDDKASELRKKLELPEFDFSVLDDTRKRMAGHKPASIAAGEKQPAAAASQQEGEQAVPAADTALSPEADAKAQELAGSTEAEKMREQASEKGEAQKQVLKFFDDLKAAYAAKDKQKLSEMISRDLPDYARFTQALTDDFRYFNNITLFQRVNGVTVSPDGKTAVANIYLEKRFMMQTGYNYNESSNISFKLENADGKWIIDGMNNNTIFGSSLLSMPMLEFDPSKFNVDIKTQTTTPPLPAPQVPVVSGADISVSNVIVKNKGTGQAKSFAVTINYVRSNGKTYTHSIPVVVLKPGEQKSLSHTFSFSGSDAFAPAAGDTLKAVIDPDHKVPELKLDDNIKTAAFPF